MCYAFSTVTVTSVTHYLQYILSSHPPHLSFAGSHFAVLSQQMGQTHTSGSVCKVTGSEAVWFDWCVYVCVCWQVFSSRFLSLSVSCDCVHVSACAYTVCVDRWQWRW